MATNTKQEAKTQGVEMTARPLSYSEIERLRLWMLESTDTDGAAAKEIGVTPAILYRARLGLTLSARSLHRMTEFIKKLPAVVA